MKINQLRYFMHVAELSSFSKAATHLRIAQPSLSRQIKHLEDELGVMLFHRDGRGARLTPAGEELLEGSVKLFKLLSDMREMVSAKAAIVDGLVTIGVPPSVGSALIPQVLIACKAAYPSLTIRVMESSSMPVLQEWLASGRVDFAVINAVVVSSQSVKSELLYGEPLYFVGHPDLKDWASDQPIALTECAKAALVVAPSTHGLRMMLDKACEDFDIEMNVAFEVDSISVMREIALRAAACAIIPYSVIKADLDTGQLFGRRVIHPTLIREMLIITSTERPPTSSGRKFRDLLQLEADAINISES